MTLEEYRATVARMSLIDYEGKFGGDVIELLPDDAIAIRVYGEGCWIAELEGGNFWLLLETDEHDTRDGHLTLRDLEELLFEWDQVEA